MKFYRTNFCPNCLLLKICNDEKNSNFNNQRCYSVIHSERLQSINQKEYEI